MGTLTWQTTRLVQGIQFGAAGFICDERKKKLNNMFPREQKVRRCFTDEERESYQTFMDTRIKNRWNKQEIDMLFDLYLAIYGRRYRTRRICTTCPGTANILRKIQTDLDRAFNN